MSPYCRSLSIDFFKSLVRPNHSLSQCFRSLAKYNLHNLVIAG